MTKKLRKPLSIILSLMMILSVFTIIPITSASAEHLVCPSCGSDEIEFDGEALWFCYNCGADFWSPVDTDAIYTVTWKNYDGMTLATSTVKHGNTPSYSGTPTRNEDKYFTYSFTGWYPPLSPVSGNTTYHAQFSRTAKPGISEEQSETFMTNQPQTVFEQDHIKITLHDTPSEDGFIANSTLYGVRDQVTAKSNEIITKIVMTRGWSGGNYNAEPMVIADGRTTISTKSGDIFTCDNVITGNAAIYANSDSSVCFIKEVVVYYVIPPTTYNVTWKNDDDVLETDANVEAGSLPSYDGTVPTKADDDQYTYEFAGWNDGTTTYALNEALPQVNSDMTFTAVFDSTDKQVAAVVAKIDALPAEVTVDDKDDIEAARAAYAALTDAQKDLVEADVLTKLEAAEAALAAAEQAAADLAAAKTNAANEVNAVNAADYISADQETVTNAKTIALAAIEVATTVAAVDTALTNFNNAIADCTTQAAAELAAAKANATDTVNAVNATDYIAADQQTVADAKTTALAAIEAAATVAAVDTALTNFNNAIADCTTQAAADLAAAKTNAESEVNAVNAADYVADDQQTVADAKTTALTAIEAAATVADVETALTDFNTAIADCTTQAAADLAAAKANAENEVNAVNAADYINTDQQKVTNAKSTALTAIEAAATVADVETALTNFNNAIADCTTQAAADLATAKANATETVNAVNATDYITSDQQTVADAKTTALAAIEAATTVAAVDTALTNFNNAIADCTTQAEADKAAADAVSDAINALPAATDVTVDNKDDIEAARDAYEALTDAQKALLAPETLAKLEAAEKALIPELVNESYIENDVSEMKIGNSITVICDSTGGAGTKQYEVWYKSSTAAKWTRAQSLSDNTSVIITPKHTGEYTVSVKVKDEAGTAVKKRMPFTVTTDLENTSEISASAILKGDSITVTCASTGGVGTKQYEVWYKRSTATKWTKAQSLSDNTSVSITPKHIGEYTISVKVKDEAGIAIKKYIPLTVTTDLENTSEISASAISKGDSITATCASTGGVGTKEYEVWYKHSTATKWTRVQRFSTNTSVVITPKHTGEYTVSVKVKDEVGTAIKKLMPLTVS